MSPTSTNSPEHQPNSALFNHYTISGVSTLNANNPSSLFHPDRRRAQQQQQTVANMTAAAAAVFIIFIKIYTTSEFKTRLASFIKLSIDQLPHVI